MKKRLLRLFGGAAAGFVNALLGAGGGMLAVPLLSALGLDAKHSHATSLALIVPLSAVSAFLYAYRGWFSPVDALPYLPAGVAGAAVGALLLRRLHGGWLKLIFGALLLWAGGRMLL